jgi:hypothetical protein
MTGMTRGLLVAASAAIRLLVALLATSEIVGVSTLWINGAIELLFTVVGVTFKAAGLMTSALLTVVTL